MWWSKLWQSAWQRQVRAWEWVGFVAAPPQKPLVLRRVARFVERAVVRIVEQVVEWAVEWAVERVVVWPVERWVWGGEWVWGLRRPEL